MVDVVAADAAVAAIAARQHAVVTAAQLAAAGLTRHPIAQRLRDGRLRRLHRGVYLAAPLPAPLTPEMAAVLACGPTALLSHHSAAALWGIRPRATARIDAHAAAMVRPHVAGAHAGGAHTTANAGAQAAGAQAVGAHAAGAHTVGAHTVGAHTVGAHTAGAHTTPSPSSAPTSTSPSSATPSAPAAASPFTASATWTRATAPAASGSP